MTYEREGLPVPAVLDIGDVFGGAYAISERYRGRFLESVGVDEADVAGPTLMRLLDALRSVPDDGVARARGAAGRGLPPRRSDRGCERLAATLAADPALDRVYRACEPRIHELLDACPERRDLIHGDLLHGNVPSRPELRTSTPCSRGSARCAATSS